MDRDVERVTVRTDADEVERALAVTREVETHPVLHVDALHASEVDRHRLDAAQFDRQAVPGLGPVRWIRIRRPRVPERRPDIIGLDVRVRAADVPTLADVLVRLL